MYIETLVLNFQGSKTEEEIYQIVLGNLNEMIIAIGQNPKLLADLRVELSDKLAQVTNQHYYATRTADEKALIYEQRKFLA